MPGSSISELFARATADLRPGSLPEDVQARVQLHIADTIGVSVAGSRALELPELTDRTKQVLSVPAAATGAEGSGVSTLWSTGEQVSPGAAAFLNGLYAHAEDFDDTHTQGIVHGSACIVPAAWAAVEAVKGTGREVIAAVAAGWEVAARIGNAAAGEFHTRGWHTTSVAGVFGAAVAAAHAFQLDASETAHALGLAGSMASGVNAYLENGSRAKTMHTGWAAHGGLLAASLAAAGLTGPNRVFESPAGLFSVYADLDASPLHESCASLGEVWEVLKVSVKPYPACHFAHAAIEAALRLRDAGVHPQDVRQLHCAVPKATYPLICDPWESKLSPSGSYAAKFSLPYLLAAALTDGGIDRSSFSASRLDREEVRWLMSRITVVPLENSTFPNAYPAELAVETLDGSRYEEKVPINLGHPDRPLTESAVLEKLRTNIEFARSAADGRGISEQIGQLPNLDSLSGLFDAARTTG